MKSTSNFELNTVAIMQPYFFPYAGYFRLLGYSKTFVIFDCVQFTRRSWISRNQFLKTNLEKDWLNMPLLKADRETKISEIEFRADSTFDTETFNLHRLLNDQAHDYLFDTRLSPIDLLCRQIAWVSEKLQFKCEFIRSSELKLDETFRGSNRVIEIARRVGAHEYINLSGGVGLYSKPEFYDQGINLKFLTPYEGSFTNILDRILTEPIDSIKQEIVTLTNFQDQTHF